MGLRSRLHAQADLPPGNGASISIEQREPSWIIPVQYRTQPVTVAGRSKARNVFARSEAEIVGSNPIQGMDVWCVCAFFCACVVLCLGRGLATNWSPVQGVLPSVNDLETDKSALCSKVGARGEKSLLKPFLKQLSECVTFKYGRRSLRPH
jgi:hypothetical protein